MDNNNEKKTITISLKAFIAITVIFTIIVLGLAGLYIGGVLKKGKSIDDGKTKQTLVKDEPEENIVLDKVLETDSIKLKYPSDWEVVKSEAYAEPIILKAPGDNDEEKAKLYITVVENTGNRTAKEIIEDATNPDYGVPTYTFAEGVKKIAEADAYYKTQSMSYDDGSNWESTTIICVKDGYLYDIMFSGNDEEYEKYYLTFEKIIETIEFIKMNDNINDSHLDNETAKTIIQSYLNIRGAKEGSSAAVLGIEEIGLVDRNSEIPGGDYVDSDNYRRTNIKYQDFKNKMLEYMTEEMFEEINRYNSYKNVDEMLYIFVGGGTGIKCDIQDIELISVNQGEYVYEINGLEYPPEEGMNFTATVELEENENGKYVVSALEWGAQDNRTNKLDDETAKTIMQSYLNIIGAKEGSSATVLGIEEIGLVDRNSEIPGGDYIDDENYRSSNIRYQDFKNKMLEYMTEEMFEEFNKYNSYKNVDGILYIFVGGGTGIGMDIQNIELISTSENSYKYEVKGLEYPPEEGMNFTATVELEENENGKYVVSAFGWGVD